jgi:rod shape-determining protein MreD
MNLVRRRVGIGTLMLVALLAQTVFFPYLKVVGVLPDVMVVATVAVAVRRGAETGALFGFGAGVAIDLFLEVPIGLSALSYTVVGYAVGSIQTGLLRERWWLVPLLGGAGSLAAGVVFVVVGLVMGQEYLFSLRTFLVLPPRALYDAVLSLAVFPLAARLIGPPDSTPAYRL